MAFKTGNIMFNANLNLEKHNFQINASREPGQCIEVPEDLRTFSVYKEARLISILPGEED